MSVWIIERVFMFNKNIPLAMLPFADKSLAEAEVKILRTRYGGEYQAVEYRRVEHAEDK
jgi:hypothetical protein